MENPGRRTLRYAVSDAPRLLSVLIPVYNEAATVGQSVRRIQREALPQGMMREIIAVDDGSTDGSGAVLAELSKAMPELRVITQASNLGKGRALSAALARAKGDVILIHDADLEYDPADHAAVLAPILAGRADAVIGSRFRGGTAHRVLYYWHAVANGLLTRLSNMMTNLNLSDIECCTKAFTRRVAERLTIEEARFGVEPELVAKLARMRVPVEESPDAPHGGGDPARISGRIRPLRIYEVPVSYAGRTYEEGKKIAWPDAVWAAWCIVRYALGPTPAVSDPDADIASEK